MALSGLRAWVVQRLTAVYMLLFSVFVLFHFAFYSPDSYTDWHGWVSNSFVLTSIALFFIALLVHMWIGLRDVAMDYVKPLSFRIAVLTTLFLVLIGLWLQIMQILLSVSR